MLMVATLADTQAWRLRVLSLRGDTVGVAFLVSPSYALTCAHVLADSDEVVLQPSSPVAATSYARASLVGDGASERYGRDIAVLECSGLSISTAPLGPLIPLKPNKILYAFGFPYSSDHLGVWSEVKTRGMDSSGECYQIDHTRQGMAIEKGFSGGPVMDLETNRVVGMTTAVAAGTAWLIPLTTIRDFWPSLRLFTISELDADPDFTLAMNLLNKCMYDAALVHLKRTAERNPVNSDVRYYQALALLGGSGFHMQPPERIVVIEHALNIAISINPDSSHAWVLIALLAEHRNGVASGSLNEGSLSNALRCGAKHRDEILRHIPIHNSATLRMLIDHWRRWP